MFLRSTMKKKRREKNIRKSYFLCSVLCFFFCFFSEILSHMILGLFGFWNGFWSLNSITVVRQIIVSEMGVSLLNFTSLFFLWIYKQFFFYIAQHLCSTLCTIANGCRTNCYMMLLCYYCRSMLPASHELTLTRMVIIGKHVDN